ncbi:2OG-Fe(II) oxygenase [Microvirga sp. STR05]|uniref:2OG-Fe(II) oxygenase n=1 Tax=Hymenobacter duratus TaxID=2771356 RepID=A0ABR8JFR2_9BACT|nr:2OG-Fe(II) oxygenase [Hymenobacter duratus]MBD2715717.1 2OG-Fe(II) oxygenase [Hymenobacter duratus]MBR7950628.1 2OG-Fe(II) oxygenase [Microvirga sp. STR05]
MAQQLIDFERLEAAMLQLQQQWNTPEHPFHYLIYDGFFHAEPAEQILAAYPPVTRGEWDGTTYINQQNKFACTQFGEDQQLLRQVFAELNGARFLNILEQITGIPALISDEELFGGGLHQSITGAFLDVHVDFNYHRTTKHHRRLNVIVYMNHDWQPDYNGYLELWDMSKKEQLAAIAPVFNRCVIFETNEISFHGHPKPLATPADLTRKSLATYYYTATRPETEITSEHNTVYVNTEGAGGMLKNLKSALRAALERVKG